jgi:AcrR family transcriptional regulator
MTTKELILHASLCLFNQEGYEATSARQIARVVRMSQGNLRYHYASKEAIAKELFDAFYSECRKIFDTFSQLEEQGLGQLLDTYRQLLVVYDEYRFVLQDLWSLTRSLPEVKRKLEAGYRDRQMMFRTMLYGLVKSGHMEELEHPELYQRLIYLELLVGDNWLAHAGIYREDSLPEEIRRYLEHGMMLLLPYLTPGGLEALMRYGKEHPDLFTATFYQLIQFHFDRISNYENISNSDT